MSTINSSGSVVLSLSEKEYIKRGVAEDFREDGRCCSDYRPFSIDTGVVLNTDGSARVKLAGTDVLVGVKLETAEPDPDESDCGRIEFDVDCSAGASPAFVARGGDELSRDIVSALTRMIQGKALDRKELCIVPGQRVWTAHVDALVLECAGGNLYDCVALAVRAALCTTEIQETEEIRTAEGEIIDWDVIPDKTRKLSMSAFPILVTLSQIGSHHVVDATAAEEGCMNGRLFVTVYKNKNGTSCALHKSGQGGVAPSALVEILRLGQSAALDMLETFDALINQ